MFSIADYKVQGVSAIKALALASNQGQKIWTIDKNNVGLALSKISLSADAENDIRNAVNAGKVATAHETRINFNGWIGEGYTLIDPETGAGAYMISGGGNGGDLALPLLLAALMGFLDAVTQTKFNDPNTLSKNLKALMKAARQVKLLGVLALVADLYLAITDDSISTTSAFGRAFTAIFSFAVISLVVGGLFFSFGLGIALIVGILFSVLLTAILSAFNDIYFSNYYRRKIQMIIA